MRILFDQGTPAPLRKFLPRHDVVTAYEQGWSTLKNGDLIAAAETEGFEIFVTTDSNVTGHFKTSHQWAVQNQPLRGVLIHYFLSWSCKWRDTFAS